ncbi:MAG TPA: PAS domain S-box protein [Gemmataceae bacterium]|nr:PAS domain S-box protein [Gemmataceae bacterium]
MRHDELEGLAQALFEESGDALFLFDPDTDQLLDANSTAQRLSGFPLRDLLRMPVTSLFHFGGDQGLEKLLQASRKSGVFHAQEGYVMRTLQEGIWVPVHLTVARLHVRPKPLGLITARDVRKHQEAHAHLEKLEAEHRRVMGSISDCLWSATIDEAGRCLYRYVSPGVETLTGQPADFFAVGIHRWWSIVHPADQARWERALVRLRGGQSSHEEYRILRPDGTHRWVRESVQVSLETERGPLRLDGVITDVTERKGTEEALRQTEEQYRRIVETASEGIWIIDSGGRTTFVNGSLTRMLGYTAEEMRARLLISFVDEESQAAAATALAQLGQGINLPHELRFRRKDGSDFWALVAWADFSDDAGVRAGTLGMITDITERRHLIAGMRLAQRRAAIEQLGGGVLHDLNNLLTMLFAFRHLLLDRTEPGDLYQRGIDLLVRTADRAASVTQWLLAFGRDQAKRPEILSLNAVVAEVGKVLQRSIGEDIHLVTAAAPALGRIQADRKDIEHLLLRLALDARAVMPEGGRLRVETANVELDAERAHSLGNLSPGPYVCLRVSDTSAAVTTKGARDRVAADDPSLVSALDIVRECGGHQEVAADPAGERTVSVYFPRVAAATDADETLVALTPESETLKLSPDEVCGVAKAPDQHAAVETILLVEDEEAVRTLVRHVLQRAGYTVLEAGEGEEALQIASQHPSPVHLLITDVVMPRMSGPELARRLQVRHPSLRTLLISGYVEKAASRPGVVSAPEEILPKPFAAATLLRKVRQLLAPAAPAPAAPEPVEKAPVEAVHQPVEEPR